MILWILSVLFTAASLLTLSWFDEQQSHRVMKAAEAPTAAVTQDVSRPQKNSHTVSNNVTSVSCADELVDPKKTGSDVDVTGSVVQQKYQNLLQQLKMELRKTEEECKNLHHRIDCITTKRIRRRPLLGEHQPSQDPMSLVGLQYTVARCGEEETFLQSIDSNH